MNDLWVRKYLTDRGFNNNDIGYDENRKVVTVQGKDFIAPNTETDGKTYSSVGDLNNALTAFDQIQNRSKVNTLVDTATQKANQPITPFNPTAQAPAQQQFSYDPNGDPQYQAALRNAQRNADQASKNAMETMNDRGILNSTVTRDGLGQIQQQEYGRVSDNILPQLMQQAYQRFNDSQGQEYQRYLDQYGQQRQNYLDQNGLTQQQFGNLSSLVPLLSGLDQQARDNIFRDSTAQETQKQNNMANYRWGVETYGYGQPKAEGDTFANQYNGAVPAFIQKMLADNAARDKGIGIDQQNANTSSRNADTNSQSANTSANNASQSVASDKVNTLFKTWAASGTAPAGLESYGIVAGTPYYDAVAARQDGAPATPNKNEIEASYISNIDALAPNKRKQVLQSEKTAIINKLGISGYNTLWNMYIDELGSPK